jgi:hypothetical protein
MYPSYLVDISGCTPTSNFDQDVISVLQGGGAAGGVGQQLLGGANMQVRT